MILERYYLDCLAHASYLLVDERTKTAAVIDPQRDVDVYLDAAASHGATIRYVLLTHFHADFVAGHLELRDRAGAGIYVGATARPEYEATGLADGDVLEFGDVRLSILETPGHTPEGISIVAWDLEQDDAAPHAVFTGDTLFIGDVGRPDLMASIGVTAEELARSLYASLHDKLLALPDETLVYPAHGAGSLCGKSLGTEPFSSIGEQRRFNYALQPMEVDAFVELVTADQPAAPTYFGYDAKMNRLERPTLDENVENADTPLTLDEVREAMADGAQVLDVREASEFAGAHLEGSLNIGLGGRFATFAGSLLDLERPIVVVADPGMEREAMMRLGRVGLDRVIGYLDGGPSALEGHEDLIGTVDRSTVQALGERLQGGGGPAVVDVRTPGEFEAGHIAGAVNLPLGGLPDLLDQLPDAAELAVVCRSGYRSSAAVSLMAAHGRSGLVDVVGGMDAWGACGLPAEGTGASCDDAESSCSTSPSGSEQAK